MVFKFLLMFIFPIVCVFSSDNDCLRAPNHARNASSIMRIVTEQAEAIQHCDGERLYLKAEKIYHTNAGLALRNDRSAILLPNLSVNQLGYYLSCRSKDDYKFTCPNCGYRWWFSETWDHLCPVCDTPGE